MTGNPLQMLEKAIRRPNKLPYTENMDLILILLMKILLLLLFDFIYSILLFKQIQ